MADDSKTRTDGALMLPRRLATILDDCVRLPGSNVRIGLDPLIGLIPVVGDVISAALSLYVVYLAALEGVPPTVLLRMLFNIVIDTFVGEVPLIGDLFDFAWKANRKNLVLMDYRSVWPKPRSRLPTTKLKSAAPGISSSPCVNLNMLQGPDL